MLARTLDMLLAVLPFAAMASPALPACSGKRLFACATVNDKVVEVCDAGATLHYAFGRAGARPELAFSIPRARATTDQWSGIGRYMRHALSLPHDGVVYSAYFAVDRLTDEHEVEAGIDVIQDGKRVATVRCDASTLSQALEGINLNGSDR